MSSTIRSVSGLHCISLNYVPTRAFSDKVYNGTWHVLSHTHKQKYCRTTFSSQSTDLCNEGMKKLCWYLGSLLIFIITISDNISYYVSSITVLKTLIYISLSHLFLWEWEKRINNPCLHMRKTRLERIADTWQGKDYLIPHAMETSSTSFPSHSVR